MENYEKIKNYIKNYAKTFSIKLIAHELGISYDIVKHYFVKLALEGEIMQIDFKRHIKTFISKSKLDSKDYQVFTSYYQKIKNYLINYNAPFTTNEIAKKLNISHGTVRDNFRKLELEGEILHINFEGCTRVFISKSKFDYFKSQGFTPNNKKSYQKIKDFVESSSQPFTAIKLSIELALSPKLISKNLLILQNEGQIKLIGVYKSKKTFISTKLCSEETPFQTNYDRIKNISMKLSNPFTASLIENELGLSNPVVLFHLRKLRKNGFIKKIGRVNKTPFYINVNAVTLAVNLVN